VRATVDKVVGVEEHYSEEYRGGEDAHAANIEVRAASGQVSIAEKAKGPPKRAAVDVSACRVEEGPMNGDPAPRNGLEVTAVAPAMRFLPALRHHPTRPHPIEDEGLLQRAGAGDAAAFKEIFLRHRSDVARLVYRMLSAPSDLEDVVQEVFVQVFRSLKDFRGQSKFSTWLHRVTVNVVLMHRRSARSRPILTEEAPSDVVPDEHQPLPDEDAERLERMRAFQRLLARLAEKKRVVFVLHELEGLPPSEIADVVGAPVLTVRTRLFYARRELEAMLGDEPSLANLMAKQGHSGEEA
jgi:RNA polymerase sigma-70 factor (ECF subfamily)